MIKQENSYKQGQDTEPGSDGYCFLFSTYHSTVWCMWTARWRSWSCCNNKQIQKVQSGPPNETICYSLYAFCHNFTKYRMILNILSSTHLQATRQLPVYSPAIHDSAHGATSIFISAYSHTQPNQPQVTQELQYAARKAWNAFKKVHFLSNDDSHWHQTQDCMQNFATKRHTVLEEIANTHLRRLSIIK